MCFACAIKTSFMKEGLRRSIPEQLAAQQEAAYAEEEETGPSLGTQKQYLLVMRHGERLDEIDVGWREKAERPWDPPLSPKGEQQVGGRLFISGSKVLRCANFNNLMRALHALSRPRMLRRDSNRSTLIGSLSPPSAGGETVAGVLALCTISAPLSQQSSDSLRMLLQDTTDRCLCM